MASAELSKWQCGTAPVQNTIAIRVGEKSKKKNSFAIIIGNIVQIRVPFSRSYFFILKMQIRFLPQSGCNLIAYRCLCIGKPISIFVVLQIGRRNRRRKSAE